MQIRRRSFLVGSCMAGVAVATGWKPSLAVTTFAKTLALGGSVLVSNGTPSGAPETVKLAPGDVLAVTAGVAAPPPPPPPPSGDWFAYAGAVPQGKGAYDGKSSLAAFLSGLAAGTVGILDYDGDRTENVSATLRDGVKVYAAPGRRPWLNGTLTLSCGSVQASLYGLSVHCPSISSSGHMVTIKSGSLDFGHAEIKDAPCYTLIHPADTIHDYRFHHLWIHDNAGPHGTANQDHGLYCSAPNPDQKGRIDHCLIEVMPHGRNIKIGSAGGGPDIAGIRVDHNTLRFGHGPSNLQFSNGAARNVVEDNVLIDSGSSTSITEGSGCHAGNTYRNNWSDRKTGPNTANVLDAGGNVVKTAAQLANYLVNGVAGKGHLA